MERQDNGVAGSASNFRLGDRQEVEKLGNAVWAAFDPDQNDQIEQAYLKWVFDPRVGSLTLVTNSYQYSINLSPNADSDLRQPHYQTNFTHRARPTQQIRRVSGVVQILSAAPVPAQGPKLEIVFRRDVGSQQSEIKNVKVDEGGSGVGELGVMRVGLPDKVKLAFATLNSDLSSRYGRFTLDLRKHISESARQRA